MEKNFVNNSKNTTTTTTSKKEIPSTYKSKTLNNTNVKESPKNFDEIIDLLESDYSSNTDIDNDDDYSISSISNKKNKFKNRNKRGLPSSSTTGIANKLKKQYKLLVRYNENFKNTDLNSLSQSKCNMFLNKLLNNIFSSYGAVNSLAILVDSNEELRDEMQKIFNCEDIIEQCSMHAYNLYSYIKMIQYKKFYLSKFNKFSSSKDIKIRKAFKFKTEDLDSLQKIRSDEISRLNSKPAMSLSKVEANNLSNLRSEKIHMEGEKSRLRLNILCSNRLKELNNSIVNSQVILNNAILSPSASLISFALNSIDLAVNSSNLLSKMEKNK